MTEDQLQQKCVMWFDERFPAHRKMLFSVPNGGKRDIVTARNMRSTGVKRGVCDLILVLYEETVFIEMKIPGGVQDDEQKNFMDRVRLRGHRYLLLWSFEEFTSAIIKLML